MAPTKPSTKSSTVSLVPTVSNDDQWRGMDLGDTSLDVTGELTEYLTRIEVERKKIVSLDHEALGLAERSGINFAEAALVLQQSTTVYGKKVDQLKCITLDACDVLSSNPIAIHSGRAAKKNTSRARAVRKYQQGCDSSIDQCCHMLFPLRHLGRFKGPMGVSNSAAPTCVPTHNERGSVAAYVGAFSDFFERAETLPHALIPTVESKPIEPLVSAKSVIWPVDDKTGIIIMDEMMIPLIPKLVQKSNSVASSVTNFTSTLTESIVSEVPVGGGGGGLYSNDDPMMSINRNGLLMDETLMMTSVRGPQPKMSRVSENDLNRTSIEAGAAAAVAAGASVKLPAAAPTTTIVATDQTVYDPFVFLDPHSDLKGCKPAEIKFPNRGGGLPAAFDASLSLIASGTIHNNASRKTSDVHVGGLRKFEMTAFAGDPTVMQSMVMQDSRIAQRELIHYNDTSFCPLAGSNGKEASTARDFRDYHYRPLLDPCASLNSARGKHLEEGDDVQWIDEATCLLHRLVDKFGLTKSHQLVEMNERDKSARQAVMKAFGLEENETPPNLQSLTRIFHGSTSKDVMEITQYYEKVQFTASSDKSLMRLWRSNQMVHAYKSMFRSLSMGSSMKIIKSKAERMKLPEGSLQVACRAALQRMESGLKNAVKDKAQGPREVTLHASSGVQVIDDDLVSSLPSSVATRLAEVGHPYEAVPVWAVEGEHDMDMGTASRSNFRALNGLANDRNLTDTVHQTEDVDLDVRDPSDDTCGGFDADAFEQAQIEDVHKDENQLQQIAYDAIDEMRKRVESLVTTIVQDNALIEPEDVSGTEEGSEVQDQLLKNKLMLKTESNLRMKEWNKKVPQFLASLENEREFDIGTYRSGIVKKMGAKVGSFESLTTSADRVELSRTFLTALLMTTDGTLNIQVDENHNNASNNKFDNNGVRNNENRGLELQPGASDFNIYIKSADDVKVVDNSEGLAAAATKRSNVMKRSRK
eukprot:GHVH01001271.1.p1 GENE.GHVH01001271.1~~GHVH01001271.1.p1  ORF type:complete len:981 (+),score=157.11 GHVH01001271.1:191-3133(+)